jgi:hypothetical protein
MMHATTVSNVQNEIIRAVSVERLMHDTEAISR